MARIRTIKPEFWDSPDTARASLRARLLFIALWNWADDYGVGTANGKSLIGFAFPNDDDVSASDFPTLRKEVADAFGVVFYNVDGRPYYAIPSWNKHQRTERKSKRQNPPPPEGVSAGQDSNDGTTDDTQGNSDALQGSSGVGTGEQGNRGTGEQGKKTLARSRSESDPEFDRFYSTYPRKKEPAKARAAWRRAIKATDPEVIISGAERYRLEVQGKEPQFIKHPSSWLNAGCWADEPDRAVPQMSTGDKRIAETAKLYDEMFGNEQLEIEGDVA